VWHFYNRFLGCLKPAGFDRTWGESHRLPKQYTTKSLSDSPLAIGTVSAPSPGLAAVVFKNIGANLARVAAISAVALLLPSFLTHHLPVTVYAAWVLIVQLGAYVSYFDLGIQTGVAKFVAEYDAKGQLSEAGRYASAGLVLMLLTGLLGVALTMGLAVETPRLFSAMPANLVPQVRTGLVLVGVSLCVGLVCSVYSAVFIGLQRYWIPTLITILNRILFGLVILIAVEEGGNLSVMGLAVALVNVFTGLLQIALWRRYAPHVSLSIRFVQFQILKKVARYCSLQSISTIAMFCITGLDIAIVGHFDYVQTAYYSIATLPTSFLLLTIASLLNPFMPASSALSTRLLPSQMGGLLERITRYHTVALFLTGLPIVVFAFPLLRIWVGPDYAYHTARYLQVLVLANIVRNLCAPYATMVTATGTQKSALAAAFSEGLVNLAASLYLASRFGAIGVAIGTAIGSFVSVLVHFAVSMRLTQRVISISRDRLLLRGILGPCVVCLPSFLLIRHWWLATNLSMSASVSVLWALGTLLPAYYCLNRKERQDLVRLILPFRHGYGDSSFSRSS